MPTSTPEPNNRSQRPLLNMTSQHEIDLKKQKLAWHDILDISSRLLSLAEQNNWQQLDTLHTLRDKKLERFFSQTIAVELVEIIQQDIKKIQEQDRHIVQLLESKRDALGDEARNLNQMKRRLNEYLSADNRKL
ncbi:flagellar protein FliT [Pseudohongiella sp. O18]|uniref:flagellar protein FliT n=1 Tax=Pseudohongiella sp. O18 TaxID=2904248 RepID=UPI001F3A060F|nr:flagellar protein FliT [Pseudohongiella sp. O18]